MTTKRENTAKQQKTSLDVCREAFEKEKLLVICVMPATAKPDVLSGVRAFEQDPIYGPVQVVEIYPTDPSELTLLQELGVDPQSATATVLLLKPQGQIIGRYQGRVGKGDLAVSFLRSQTCRPDGSCCG